MTVTYSARAADDEPSDEMNETHAHMSLNDSMLKYHSNPQPPYKHIDFVKPGFQPIFIYDPETAEFFQRLLNINYKSDYQNPI